MQKKNHLEYILPTFYGLSIFLFFGFLFPYHLHFQEQFQLFLFKNSFFMETCSRPGGFCNYTGQFITQFYISSFAGALLVSCLLIGIQQLTFAIMRRFYKVKYEGWSQPAGGLLFSFLPSLFCWYLLCDENWQIGGIIALLFALIAAFIGTFPKSQSSHRNYLLASIPVLYWIAGGIVIIYVILLIGYAWIDPRRPKPIILSISAVSFASILPFIAKFFLIQYPISRFWWGVDYLIFINNSPAFILYLWLMILLVVTGVLFFPKRRVFRNQTDRSFKRLFGYSALQFVVLLLAIYFVILKNAYPQNLSKEEIMAYDYHCRMRNWDKIIEMADRKSPTVPITVTCLNLALYKTGQLPDKMFHYFQNGPEGLLPTFKRDILLPMVGGEPYWYLGFVNTAQRFAFEAMEVFPDSRKSVRSIKRMAEANLLNGYHEVASKYISLLENTLFYSNWAKETRSFLYNEDKIDAHPEWGEIRRFQTDKDFIFSERERDMMLGIFFQQHLDNRMAYEYLLAYALLTKDIRNFSNFFVLEKDFEYAEIPQSYQEALVYIWGLNNNNMDSIPFQINQSVIQHVAAYANIYTSVQLPEPALRRQFSNTYWYYYHFREFNQVTSERPLQY